MKRWTTEEEQFIIKNAKYDHRGFVCNYRELAELIGCDKSKIYFKIRRMRLKGQLFEIYWDDPINPPASSYSRMDEKRIISMYKSGCSTSVIAQELNRTEYAITNKLRKLFKEGRLSKRNRPYTKEDINLLIREIKFDENGYVKNVEYLTKILNRTKIQIFPKVCRLRKEGLIKTKPDRSKSNKNWYDAIKRQNELSYRLYLVKQKKPTSFADEVSTKQK
ncbi:Uncharacterised protein [Enterococcus faecalis]|uniref:hypothetical protein n=1 Tax=Enterococcus faecalis TaxID=1351 RepID=UPI000E036F85|nr:hypothetical protein [Enterococcus faecalis]STP90901.1 Uncharacterised protein [Enterococcus faecalis]HAP5255321.1 hypothetical protein [Enterococcus faecalis]HAP5571510.1 hypothetical protein [Enterococcus faecalis]